MLSDKTELKCGKILLSPSTFVNPQYGKEAEILRKTVARYPKSNRHDGLNQIDGLVASIKDWNGISKHILAGYIADEPEYKLKDRIIMIDPSLYVLFTGTDPDKESLLSSTDALSALKDKVWDISSLPSQKEKVDTGIRELYPLLDTQVIRDLLEFQIRNGASILMSPSVPVTSQRKIEEQINKAKEMNRISRILLDTVFSAYRENRDLMHVLALNLSVLKPDYIEQLKESVLTSKPDHIGLRVMNLNQDNTSQIWAFLHFIQELTKANIPIHVFNVREFGYVTFYYGASTITTPVATDPYFWRVRSEIAPPRQGAYYHPIDMTNDTFEMLLEKTRSNNYRFPCHCEICDRFLRVIKVDKKYWNEFRRVHFLLVKNMEMKELRETASPLNIALKDKFARSQQTVWLPFLD